LTGYDRSIPQAGQKKDIRLYPAVIRVYL